MKTNQKTLVKEEKKNLLHQVQESYKRQAAQGTRICIQRGNTEKDQAKGWPRSAGSRLRFYCYENTRISCSPYGSSAFPRPLPVGRWEILLFASEAGGEWSCILRLRSRGMVWCRAEEHNSSRCWLDQSFPHQRSPFYTWGKLRLIKQIRIRFRVLS